MPADPRTHPGEGPMCNLCNQGTLGYSPDGELVFCTCIEGTTAQMADSVRLMSNYAHQLEVIDGIKVPALQTLAYRKNVQIAYDCEVLVHDDAERRWAQMREAS